MTIAFLPWPVSIYEIPGVSKNAAQCPPPLKSSVPLSRFHMHIAGDVPLRLCRPNAPVSCRWCV